MHPSVQVSDAKKIEVKEEIPASRKLGASDAKAIAKESSKVYVAKGKKLDVFDMKTAKLGDVAEKMLTHRQPARADDANREDDRGRLQRRHLRGSPVVERGAGPAGIPRAVDGDSVGRFVVWGVEAASAG